ncbi:MAG: NfeD family protein [Elusimicrobiota bacterium]
MKNDFSKRSAWALAAGLFYAVATVGISSGQNAKSGQSRKVVVISLDSEITLGLSAYVRRALEETEDARAIVLRVDTFGGRVDAALEIAKNVEKPAAPVFAWVEDKAWSAGALISLACSEIYMSKSASIGSATPVQISGGKTKAVGEKHVSALRAKFRALAERNNYPPELAAAMVDKDIEVYRIKSGDEYRFITAGEVEKLKKEGALKGEPELIIAKGKLLNLSAQKAVEYGLAESADSIRALLKKEGIDNPRLVPIKRTGIEKFINVITGSAATSLLVFLGFMLISGEMHMPGFGWMGATGVACFIVVFWGHYLADLAGWIDLLLVLAGLFLIGLEIFVVPGFGITGISGFALLVAGLYLMVVPFVVPSSPWEWDRLKEVVWVLVAAGAGGVAGVLSLILMIPRLPMFNRKALATDAGSTAPADPLAEGELAEGRRGLAITEINPTGRVQFGTQFVEARAKSGAIAKGANVEVVERGDVPVVRTVR